MLRFIRKLTLLALATLAGFVPLRAAEPPAPAAKAFLTNSIGMKLVLVPSGEFMMGSSESAEETAAFFKKALRMDRIDPAIYRNERPQHRVQITRPFYIGACHVTRGQFRRFVEDTNYRTSAEMAGWSVGARGWDAKKKTVEFDKDYSWRNTGFQQTDEHPVLCVSWYDAALFCRWLSRKEGRTYRLPTEAEWEYACRAGTTTRFWCGDDPEELAQVGNVGDAKLKELFPKLKGTLKASDGYVFTSPAASFRPNAFSLYDMHGNAQQWCADWYAENYYALSPANDPQGPEAGEKRVVRGSTWASAAYCAGAAKRFVMDPDDRDAGTGFRVVLVAQGAAPGRAAAARFDGRITILPETTRIVGPLDKDGNVDYLAALNLHCRQEVTAENNAAIPLWQALGPGRLTPGTAERFYRMLGIKPLPRDGKYLILLCEYADTRKELPVAKDGKGASIWDTYEPALQRPWSAEEFPLLAGWLQANETPLAKLHGAAGRSRYYSPLVSSEEPNSILTVSLPDAQHLREGARLLMAHAMLRLHEGRLEEAWRDVLACHRLARLCGQTPISVQHLVARALHQMACQATAILANRNDLDPKFAARMLADLDALPPLPRSADALNLGERCEFLETLGRVVRGGPREIKRVVDTVNTLSDAANGSREKPSSDAKDFPDHWSYNESVDWDLVAVFGNHWFDMLARISEKAPSYRSCVGAHSDMDKQLSELTDMLAGGGAGRKVAQLNLFLGRIQPEVKSFDLFGVVARLLTPACYAMDWSEYRAKAEFELARLSLALTIYQHRTGKYPAMLDRLAPSILTTVPVDPFTDKGMHYEVKGGTYILYSLGPCETDEGGRDRDSQPPGWNVILPLPVAPETKAAK